MGNYLLFQHPILLSDGTKVHVACDEGSNNGYVYIIDAVKNKVTSTVFVGSLPYVVAVTPDGKRVYVTNGISNTISVIDTATNKVTATMNVGHGPNSFGIFIGSLQAQ